MVKLSKLSKRKAKKLSLKYAIHKALKAEMAKFPSKATALKSISGQTGIGVPWLDKFSADPDLYDPGLSKIETLHVYFYGMPIQERFGEG